MEIMVDGQRYDSWDQVPADVQATLLSALPDADANGVPDLFEGQAPDVLNVEHEVTVHDAQVTDLDALPPDVRRLLGQLGLVPAPSAAPEPPQPAAEPPAAGRVVINGQEVDYATALGATRPKWWQFWK